MVAHVYRYGGRFGIVTFDGEREERIARGIDDFGRAYLDARARVGAGGFVCVNRQYYRLRKRKLTEERRARAALHHR